ncbi:MAG: 2-dehydropantoate 2-reductase [Planctomycetota bacterium]
MRAAIYGAGAVGCVFGSALARAGHDVTFIARGTTLGAIRSRGVRIERTNGDTLDAPNAAATDDPAEIGPVDLVLVCTKVWQVPEIAPKIRPLLKPDQTAVIPLQNGVDAPHHLASALGEQHVLPGSCRVICEIKEPAVIQQTAFIQEITFGEFDDRPSDRVQDIAETLRAAEIAAVTPESIWAALWWKFAFISTLSAVGTVARMDAGQLRTNPETRDLLERCLAEICDVGRARGVPIPDGTDREILAFIDTIPADMTTSMQRDWQAGRPSELDAQPGAVVRLGQEAGVPTPVCNVCYRVLAPAERRARA